MNEKLIRDLIKLKLDAGNEILNCLPQRISDEIKEHARIILESINENTGALSEQLKKPKPSGGLNDITIE